MSLISAIYNSMSALDATGTGITTVGNNLANVNTDGFKESQTTFGDVLNSVLGQTSSDDIGSGVDVQAITTQFTNGTIQNTSNPLDFAISGDGFFVVKNISRRNEIDYTRAGSFSLDKTGNIVDSEGDILQGYLADAAGNISKSLTNLTLPLDAKGNLTTPAVATKSATVIANLNSSDTVPALSSSFDSNNNTIDFMDAAGNNYTATIASQTYTTGDSLATAVQTALNNASYNIPSGTTLNLTDTTSGASYGPISIAAGPYTAANLANTVQTALNGAGAGNIFAVNYDSTTHEFSVVNNGLDSMSVSGGTLPQGLGFNSGTIAVAAPVPYPSLPLLQPVLLRLLFQPGPTYRLYV